MTDTICSAMTVLTPELLRRRSTRPVAPIERRADPPARASTRREEFLAFEQRGAVRPRVAVRRPGRAASRTPATSSPSRRRRAADRRPRQGRRDPRLLGGLPAPRHAGVRGRAATAPRSPARTTTGSTASTAACSARRPWSARDDFDKKDCGLPDLRGRGVAGLRVRQPRPRRRAARADARRATSRTSSNYDLDRRRVPRHVHAHRPAVELEGDVRELQRRLPRQPAPPVRPGLLPERRLPRSRCRGTTPPT